MDFLRLTVAGRLTRDPQSRTIEMRNGEQREVCNFTVATTDPATKKKEQPNTNYIEVTAWGGLAKICQDYLVKGQVVLVEGKSLTVDVWTPEQGEPRASLKLTADTLQMGSKSGENSGGGAPRREDRGAPQRDNRGGGYDNRGAPPRDDRGRGGYDNRGGGYDNRSSGYDNRGAPPRDDRGRGGPGPRDYARSGSGERYDMPAGGEDVPF